MTRPLNIPASGEATSRNAHPDEPPHTRQQFTEEDIQKHEGVSRNYIDSSPTAMLVFHSINNPVIGEKKRGNGHMELPGAEKDLQGNEYKYRDYIDGSPVAILVFGSDGKCLDVNPSACKLTGCSQKELLSLNVRNLIPVESVENAQYHIAEFKKHGRVVLDLEFRHKDKSMVYLTLNVVSISEDRYIAFGQDITERKLAHYALRASERLYRTIIDSMNDAICVVDQNLKVVLLNKTIITWCEKFGLKKATQGQSLKEAFPFFSEKACDEYQTVFETGTLMSSTDENRFNDQEISTETVKIPIIENGKTVRVVTVIRDVTEQKKTASQYLRAQRMECIGTLASGVAHDLNNVLSPILMGAGMLHDELPHEMREQLISTIETAAQRGAGIVKQVLTFARGVECERMLLRPHHLVHEMEKIARETFPKSITIVNSTQEGIWNVEGDTTQLHQVFLNLCVNARDAMPEGGTLTVAVENIELDDSYASMVHGAKAGSYVVFKVSDTGIGISHENMERIFDPFFTTKKLGQGTGLGLSMVMGIAKSHGGFVTVNSKTGAGSEFKVFIPAAFPAQSKEDAVSSEEQKLHEGNGELVLLVDDEDGILDMAEAILKKHGYQVITAHDGVEAISSYATKQEEVKLVLTDIMMPFVDGVALARALRKMNPGIRIIASTGQAEKSRQTELRSHGIDLFLNKPYTSKQLLQTITKALA